MKTTRRYQRSIRKKYTRRKNRVASFKSMQTDDLTGQKIRAYLISYSKFWSTYEYYHPHQDRELVTSFLKHGATNILAELDGELFYYHSFKWDQTKLLILFVDLVEQYLKLNLEPKLDLCQKEFDIINDDFYVSDSLFSYQERMYFYYRYIAEWDLKQIQIACCHDYLRRKTYEQQTIKKLKTALGLLKDQDSAQDQ